MNDDTHTRKEGTMTDQQNPYPYGRPTPQDQQSQGTAYGQPTTPQPTYGPQPGYGPQPMPGQPSNPSYRGSWAPGGMPPGGPYPAPGMEPALNQPYYRCPFPQAIRRFFGNYAAFTGRASRSEYWWPVLGYNIVMLLIEAFGKATGHDMGWLESLFSLAVTLPFIAVMVRRLHDSNRSGWWAALPMGLSIAGVVFAFIFAAQFAFELGSGISTQSGALASGSANFAMVIWILLMLGCLLASLVVTIVFMTTRPDSRGARFDDNALPPMMPPSAYNGPYGGYTPNVYPYGNGYPPYDPTNAPYPNAPRDPAPENQQRYGEPPQR